MSYPPQPRPPRRLDPASTPGRLLLAGVVVVLVVVAAWWGVTALRSDNGSGSAAPTPSGSPTSAPSTSGAPAGTAKPYIVGLMTRDGPPPVDDLTYDGKPLVSGYVIQVRWNEVQPGGPDDFDTSSIDKELVFAREHNLPVRFRIYAGYSSPKWVLSEAGSVAWKGTANEAGPGTYQIPQFWNPKFQELFQEFDHKLADKYDPDPLVREVVAGMCITNFAEPFIRQFNVPGNAAAARADGYTDDLNNACLKKTIDIVKGDWPTTNYAMAFNPYQSVNSTVANDKTATTAAASVQVPEEIAKYCLSVLGSRCILGNNSMKGGTRGPAYDALYAMMKSLGAPVYIQTAADKKIGDWQGSLQGCVDVGAQSVELPAGYTSWDKATLQSFAEKLKANAKTA